jgi:hypothetical protein
MVVVVFDTFGAERFDAGHSCTEVSIGFPLVLGACVFD